MCYYAIIDTGKCDVERERVMNAFCTRVFILCPRSTITPSFREKFNTEPGTFFPHNMKDQLLDLHLHVLKFLPAKPVNASRLLRWPSTEDSGTGHNGKIKSPVRGVEVSQNQSQCLQLPRLSSP